MSHQLYLMHRPKHLNTKQPYMKRFNVLYTTVIILIYENINSI